MTSTPRLTFLAALVLSVSFVSVACDEDDSPAPAPSGSAGTGGTGAAAGTGGGAGSGPKSDQSYRDYQTKILKAGCERTARCSEEPKPVEECLAKYDTPETKTQVDTFEKGVNEGRIAYDADQGEAAIAANASYACDKGLDVVKVSNEVLTGLVKEGDECFAHVECADADETLKGKRLCVDGCDFLTGETGKPGTCQVSPISTGACPSKLRRTPTAAGRAFLVRDVVIAVRVEHIEDEPRGERRRLSGDALEGDLQIGLGHAPVAIDVDRAEAAQALPQVAGERVDQHQLALAPRARVGYGAGVRSNSRQLP